MHLRTRADRQCSHTCGTDMDFLGDFGRKRSGGGSSSSPGGSPYKKPATDPGRVQVEIKCDQFCVGAKWHFGAERLKSDLVAATIPEYSNGLAWNVPKKKWINAERNSEPPAIELTCPSQEFLRVLCKACHDSPWCSGRYITGRGGRTIPCSAADIETLEVDFDEPALPREAEEATNDAIQEEVRKVQRTSAWKIR